MSIMTRQDKIEVLQDWVSKNHITNFKNLCDTCDMYGLEPYEDILSPMEWNSCDRCGDLWETDRLYWEEFDTPDEYIPDSIPISRAVNMEHGDYCALCGKCVEELKKKGLIPVEGESRVEQVAVALH